MINEESAKFARLVERYRRDYPWEHLKKFPEFSLNKLRNGFSTPTDLVSPDDISLSELNPLKERIEENDRDNIVDWIKNNLDYKTLEYIGW